MSTFRRQLTPFLRADSPYKKYSPVVMDYTPPHSYEAIAPADEATVPSQHDEYQIGTLNIKHTASGVYYTRTTDFEEVRPGQWINHGIPPGTGITVEYLLTDDAGDGNVRLEWEGVEQPGLSTWNFTGPGIASIGVFEGKLRFVLEGGGGGGGVVDILGEYDPAVSYMAGDVIVYDNILWTVLNDSTIGITPVEGTDYTQIAVMGLDGNTILYGVVPPTGGIGANGDFYIDTAAKMIYGPKASGAWPSGTSIVGPPGIQGVPGSRWYSGAGPPAGSLGAIQDWYLNDDNGDVYEKTGASTWTLKDNLRGPEGSGGGGGGGGGIVSTVELASDVSTTSTSYVDVTDLDFDFEANVTYRFRFTAYFTVNAGTIGSRWSVAHGLTPPLDLFAYTSRFPAAATTQQVLNSTTADDGTVSANTGQTAGVAIVEGVIRHSTGGTLRLRFAVETGGTLTAKAKSVVEYSSGQHLTSGGPFIDVVGAYDSGTFYNAGQAVYYGGALWAALLDNTVGVTPVEGASWTRIAEQGEPGADGRTLLHGTGAPGGGVGQDGDFYVDTVAWEIYGPKTGGAWGSGTPMLGDDGNAIRYGTTAPGGGVGNDDDFYINTTSWDIYGPKTGGSWGSPTSLVAPTFAPSHLMTASGNIPTDRHFIKGDCSSGNVVATLPTAVGRDGAEYVVKKMDATTNSLTVDTTGTEKVENLDLITTIVKGDAVRLKSDNANWWIVSPPTFVAV